MASTWVAHRGDCRSALENTYESVSNAIESGLRHIEIDIQITRDGVPVVFHDSDLTRLAGRSEKIAQLSYQELKQIPLRNCNHPHSPGLLHHIASLSDISILIAKHPHVTLFVEVKKENFLTYSYQFVHQKIQTAIELIINQCVLISFSYRYLRTAQRFNSNISCGYVIPSWHQFNSKSLRLLQPKFIYADTKIVPADFKVNQSHPIWVLYEITSINHAKKFHLQGFRYFESYYAANFDQKI